MYKIKQILWFLSFFCFVFRVRSNPNSIIVPCKITDEECMSKSANIAVRLIGPGVPSLGIEPIDPIKYDLVELNLPTIKITFKNTTITGFSKCEVTNVKLNMDSLNLKFDLKCPSIEMKGNYVISGTLLSLPLEGQGTSRTVSGTYLISVDADMKRVTGKDGKTYLAIQNLTPIADPVEQTKFQFDNLFNGQKELSDAAHAFAHKNSKEIMKLFQDPLLQKMFKLILTSVNELLKTTPIDNLFVK